MRWLMNYLRQCFCRHDFKTEEHPNVQYDGWSWTVTGDRVSLLCSRCGYHRSFWKWF